MSTPSRFGVRFCRTLLIVGHLDALHVFLIGRCWYHLIYYGADMPWLSLYTAILLGCFPDPGYRVCFGHYGGHRFHVRNYVVIMSRYSSNLTPYLLSDINIMWITYLFQFIQTMSASCVDLTWCRKFPKFHIVLSSVPLPHHICPPLPYSNPTFM